MRIVLTDGSSHVVRGNIECYARKLHFTDSHGKAHALWIVDVQEIQIA